MQHQGKTEKQLTDSMKIVLCSCVTIAAMFAANIICDFFLN
jgi:hypothetical protein